jgi:hypothetical protein
LPPGKPLLLLLADVVITDNINQVDFRQAVIRALLPRDPEIFGKRRGK